MQLSTFVQSIFNLDLLDLHGCDFPTWSEVGTNYGGKSESIPNHTNPYQTLPNNTKPYQTIPHHTISQY